eukprot:Selendium_serpulae@DN6467_c1_g3_i4.p1
MKNEQLTAECLSTNCLQFGKFVLKSGREAPFFFNSGQISRGKCINTFGRAFAHLIVESEIQFDVLFGSAYKGIPLVAATANALYTDFGLDYPYFYNRKEPKDHGEGGVLVGADTSSVAPGTRVLIIDDVLTSGMAARESIDLLKKQIKGVVIAALIVIFDREERVDTNIEISAAKSIEEQHSIRVLSLLSLRSLIEYLEKSSSADASTDALTRIQAYQQRYGA